MLIRRQALACAPQVAGHLGIWRRALIQRAPWHRALLHLALWLTLAIGSLMPTLAQAPPDPTAALLERVRLALDHVEGVLKSEAVTADTLAELRRTSVAAREELRLKIEELEPRVAEVEARLKQLGPAPKDGAPEERAVTTEREQITQSLSQQDGWLKQARLLAVRADQLGDRIVERRRSLYAREVFQRGASAIDPFFWRDAVEALPGELASIGRLLHSWADTAVESGATRIFAAALLILLMIAAMTAVSRWWLPRFNGGRDPATRFARARAGVLIFVWLAVRTPLTLFVAILVLDAFGLLPYRINEITNGLVVGVMAAAFGHAVGHALLAPERPQRRLVALDDATARCFYDHLVWSTRIFGLTIFLQVTHKAMFAPLAMTVATNALFALAVAGLLIHLVRCLRRAELRAETDTIMHAPGARLAAWVVALGILFALIAGYAALAAFASLRVVVAVAVLGALYLFLAAADALFTEALAPDTPRGRAIAANLGVNPRTVGLVATLLSAVIRVMLIGLALLVIVGPWEASTADLMDSVRNVPSGLRIGEINISLSAIAAAVALLGVALLLTRWAQRWLQRELLPRTSLEPSLQLSVTTIFGYLGAILAVTLAMASLGIDLQKIAFVAGALSVGIGFGLQSIISNFVSGLILLAERPIRVGDAIVVQGEEGWVRRIRVRATEIETYERASVIIPNSALITGMVKNWTHANTMGRIIVKVGAGYASDPEQVRDMLLQIANAHPQVLKDPPAGAFFAGFGASSLDFELRCVVNNVANGLGVKSDLHIAILKQFREAGIEIPFPQSEVRVVASPQSSAQPSTEPSSGAPPEGARPQSS